MRVRVRVRARVRVRVRVRVREGTYGGTSCSEHSSGAPPLWSTSLPLPPHWS